MKNEKDEKISSPVLPQSLQIYVTFHALRSLPMEFRGAGLNGVNTKRFGVGGGGCLDENALL